MPDELPPVPKRRSDPEMQNFVYKGGKPGPRRRPNPRLENPIYEQVSVNDENAILRAQNDELARAAIGMKAAWMEARREVEYLKRLLSSESITMNNWQVRYREWVAAGMPDDRQD